MNETLVKENALLHQKIDLLVRRVFGSSSEQLDSKQMELLLGLDREGKEEQGLSSILNNPVFQIYSKSGSAHRSFCTI